MGDDFEFSIVNSDNMGFVFPTVISFEDNYDNPVTPFSLPGQDSDNNILISITGPTTRLRINFEFQDLGRDFGVNNTEDVITIQEQIEWFKKSVLTPKITEVYKFTVWDPVSQTRIIQEDVLVETFTINYDNERPGGISGTLVAVIGRNPLSLGGAL